MSKRICFTCLLAVQTLGAITIAGTNPNGPSTLIAPGGAYDGVAMIRLPDGICSGSLIAPTVVLTAAHCVTDGNGNLLALNSGNQHTASFNLTGGWTDVNIASVSAAPGWKGVNSGDLSNDIAVVHLSQSAPVGAEIYSLYTGAPGSEIGNTLTLVGYGFGGTGANGYDTSDTSCPGTPNALACKRQAINVYEGTENAADGTLYVGSVPPGGGAYSDLVYDYPSPSGGGNPLGGSYLGPTEGLIAPGDSGGPSFIGGKLAGVHSYLTCAVDNSGNCIDTGSFGNNLVSSFGDIAADTEVALFEPWIQAQETQAAPEPGTWAMALLGVAGVALGRRRMRRARAGAPADQA